MNPFFSDHRVTLQLRAVLCLSESFSCAMAGRMCRDPRTALRMFAVGVISLKLDNVSLKVLVESTTTINIFITVWGLKRLRRRPLPRIQGAAPSTATPTPITTATRRKPATPGRHNRLTTSYISLPHFTLRIPRVEIDLEAFIPPS